MDYELKLKAFYTAMLRPGDVALDIGAHVGYHAIPMAASVAAGGRVFAVEPLEICSRQILWEVKRNHPALASVLRVDNLALGNFVGKAEFRHAVDAPAYSGLQPRIYDTPTAVKAIQVKVSTIDQHFAALDHLKYIKIDAEGGELHILQGAAATLQRHRPVVSFEFGLNSIGSYGITCEDMARFWEEHDYRIYDILGQPLPTVTSFVASSTKQAVWDYVAFPAEKLELLRFLTG